MSQILAGQDDVQCYLDDTIVYGDNPELHEKRLKSVLQRLQNCGLKLNVKKCRFRKTELPCNFRFRLASRSHSSYTASTSPSRCTLRSFFGLAGWYSKFIPNYATLVEPLRALLRKSIGFCWTDEA